MRHDVIESELIYGRAGEMVLSAQWYRPNITKGTIIPAVVDVHGGAWSTGSRLDGQYYNRALAAGGCGVIALDFRHGPDFQHPAATADITAGVRFVRENADRLGVDPERIALAGSSSGGHLALLAGLNPDIPEHRTTEVLIGDTFTSADQTSAAVACVIALWPVSDPLARYQYVNSFNASTPREHGNFTPERLAAGHRAYFQSQEIMHHVAIQRIVTDGEFQHLPPVLLVQPELDQNVPVFMSQTLAGAYALAGGTLSLSTYRAVGHGFATRPGPASDTCIDEMLTFLTDMSAD